MCNEKPCFTSVCGLPLKTSVLGIGVLELVGQKGKIITVLKDKNIWFHHNRKRFSQVITVVATALNVVKFVSHVELFTECEVLQSQCL